MNQLDLRKYLFVGNREYTLKEMIRNNLQIAGVLVMEGSYLHKTLCKNPFIEYQVIYSKTQLLESIGVIDFDILLSNGCKYILPIDRMKPALYINVHPSYLPDLKGKDPINGACLFNRPAGATCHVMDNGIDTGSIISRIKIDLTPDIDASLLFQLCFKAEVLAFNAGFSRNFKPIQTSDCNIDSIYYSMSNKDLLIDFTKGFDYILRQSKAFCYRSKGLFFKCNNKVYHFFRATEVINPFIEMYCSEQEEYHVIFSFEDSIIFRFENRYMRFDQIENKNSEIFIGDYISMCSCEEIVCNV